MSLLDPASNKKSRIVLLGFMGAGKTTIGAMLASRLGWAFHDADAALEKRTGLSIAEVFTRDGEQGFRALEAETVAELMQQDHVVIALGGGAIESPSTRSLLGSSANIRTVFLDAPLKTMLDRCQASPIIRPLLQDREAIHARYERRLPQYQSAEIAVNTEGLTPEEVVDILSERLHEPPVGTEADENFKGRSL